MMIDVMSCEPDDVHRPHGLTADEEKYLMINCLRDGVYPRTVVIERTGTIYEIRSRRQAQKLLRLLGIET